MAITDLLATNVVQGVIDDLADVSTLPQTYIWTNRIPSVEADDGEILARYTGRIIAAELLMTDQKAIVRQTRPLRLQQTEIPKIKHGFFINEAMQAVLRRIEAQSASRRDLGVFEDYVARQLIELRDGIYARQESMLVAMLVDSFSYNRNGIIVENVNWGMPSDGKVTPANLWTDATNAKPITDILTLRNLYETKYGIRLNRATMSLTAWNNMIGTVEFRDKANLYRQLVGVTAGNFPTADRATMQALAARMLDDMIIETYDAQIWVENNDGSETNSRLLPVNKVVLSATQFDGNTAAWDWANGIVPETAPGQIPLMIGEGFGGERSGPVAYATAADPHGNPPGQILWAASRGFPRKHRETATAVLTVA